MTTMTRAQFRKSLQDGLNTHFGLEYRNHPEEWRSIFSIQRSNKAFEEDVLVTGFGGAPEKAEGGPVAYDSGGEGWVARYTHVTISLAFALTEEAMEDNLYNSLGSKYARHLARAMRYTKEIRGANILNNGFDSNYTGGDGKSLFATDHPLAGGGTLSNTFETAMDLSEAAIENALISIDGFVDDRGIPIKAMGKKLIVPKELRYVACRLMETANRPATADNDINAIRRMNMLPDGYDVNHYLSDPDNWFIPTDVPDGLKHFLRKGIQRGTEGDFETGNMRYKTRERYSFGWTDFRGAYGSGN